MEQKLFHLNRMLTSEGGSMHPALSLHNASHEGSERGCYIAVAEQTSIDSLSTLLSVPLSMTISIINTPDIAPFWPLSFIERYHDEPQILSRFLVMEAWLQGRNCFWWPYLEALPQPRQTEPAEADQRDPFDTPLFWSQEERSWLKGTRLAIVVEERDKLWKSEFEAGLSHLAEQMKESDVGRWPQMQPALWNGYTWGLYKWAATVLTSRSFASSILNHWKPHNAEGTFWQSTLGKAWTAKSEKMRFPVLVAVLDMANHLESSPVSWATKGDRCTLTALSSLAGVSELCINYDANSNDKLLIGYGFMIENNPHDRVQLTASTSDGHSNNSSGSIEDGRPGLSKEDEFQNVDQIQRIINSVLGPKQLLALSSKLANNREKLASEDYRISNSLRIVSILTDKVILGLKAYYNRLENDMPTTCSNSRRLKMAKDYRHQQLEIVASNLTVLDTFLAAELSRGSILSVSRILQPHTSASLADSLVELLENACDIEPTSTNVLQSGLHELVFTIYICLNWIQLQENGANSTVNRDCLEALQTAYGEPTSPKNSQHSQDDEETDAIVASYLDVVQYAADALPPDSVFANPGWTLDLLRWGLRVFRQETITLESQQRLYDMVDGQEHEEMLFWLPGGSSE